MEQDPSHNVLAVESLNQDPRIEERLADWRNQRFPDQEPNCNPEEYRHSPLVRQNGGIAGFNDFTGTLKSLDTKSFSELPNYKVYITGIKDKLIKLTQYWYTNKPYGLTERIREAQLEANGGDKRNLYVLNSVMTHSQASAYVKEIILLEEKIALLN